MSKRNPPLVAWDTTVLLAWLNKEEDKPLDEIAALLDQITSGKINLLISQQVRFELSSVHYADDQLDKVDRFLKRPSVQPADITGDISRLAGEIRDCCMQRNHSWRKADLYILATAIHYHAIALHTLDVDHLLRLNGTVCARNMRICLPCDPSGQLPTPGLSLLDDPLE